MNIVILGAGEIGTYIASILSKEEHNVFIIDKDAKQLEKINQKLDVQVLISSSSIWQMLENLLENDPTLFIGMTGDDETNLVACNIAKNLGFPSTIARVKEISYLTKSRLNFSRLFFVDHFISSEILTANDIVKNIISSSDIKVENFANGSIQMQSFEIPSSWDKSTISLKDLELPEDLLISLIIREDKIIFPNGDDVLKPHDEITIIGKTYEMNAFHKIFGLKKNHFDSVILIGGSKIAVQLSYILERLEIPVTIIEENEAKCKQLSYLFKEATILHHDGTDLNFLKSQRINETSMLIACTNDDAKNLLIALLGKHLKCKKIIKILSNMSLTPILRNLDIEFSLSEKINVANRILSIIYAETIISMSSLYNNRVKVLEIKVSPDSQLVGLPLEDLKKKLPKEVLIAAIENRASIIIGKGNKIISPNDTIIIITIPEHIQKLQEIF